MVKVSGKPTTTRYTVAVMLFVTVVVNYICRSNLSVTASLMARDFGLDNAKTGLLLSAFGWTYAAMQLPGGWLVDRVQPRLLYAICLVLWSVATIGMGVAGSFAALIVLRLAVGVFEAPSYPINNKVVTAWFPERERATAIGFYTSAQFIGVALLTPVLLWLQHATSWHWVFFVTGAAGVLWGLIWYFAYANPIDSKRANGAEIDYIREGGGLAGAGSDRRVETRPALTKADFALILSRRKLWGCLSWRRWPAF